MNSEQQKLQDAVLQAKRRGFGVRKTSKLLGISKTTTRRLYRGVPFAGSRIAPKAVANFNERRATLLPVAPRARPQYPAQLKQLNQVVWRAVKEKCIAWGYEICARWWNTTPKQLRLHVISRSQEDASSFLARLHELGIPGFSIHTKRYASLLKSLSATKEQLP